MLDSTYFNVVLCYVESKKKIKACSIINTFFFMPKTEIINEMIWENSFFV